MTLVRTYENYQDYIDFQKQKTTDPARIKKWLNDEWDTKINGFTAEFSKIKSILRPEMKILCLGARLGHEVVALKNMGFNDVIGIDIVPYEPNVISGDIHNLHFEDESFDFIYTNIIDHSVDPKKMVSEIERVLRVDGFAFIQTQLGIDQDEYTEFKIENPFHDVLALFDRSYCIHFGFIHKDRTSNFAGMNFELIIQKDKSLNNLYNKYGTLSSIEVPSSYKKIWEEVNLKIQEEKLNDSGITLSSERDAILNGLMRRAFYLTRLVEAYGGKNVAEVGTAQGWQFYSFCEYAKEVGGTVYSCDIRDVRDRKYSQIYETESEVGKFILGNSTLMSNSCNNIDVFYIDGSHDKGAVIDDVKSLIKCQSNSSSNVWIFDDFDTRFGCFNDIIALSSLSRRFRVMCVGTTASGEPSHQVISCAKFSI